MPMREARPPGHRRAVRPRPRTRRRHCTTGSSLARGDRPRLARPCSPARARPGTRAGAGTSQPPIPPTDLGSGATCRSRVPQRTARACCISPTVAQKPGSVIPAGGQLPYRLAAPPTRLQPVSARTPATTDGAPWAARPTSIDVPAGQAAAGARPPGSNPLTQRPASACCWWQEGRDSCWPGMRLGAGRDGTRPLTRHRRCYGRLVSGLHAR